MRFNLYLDKKPSQKKQSKLNKIEVLKLIMN